MYDKPKWSQNLIDSLSNVLCSVVPSNLVPTDEP